MKMPALFIGHGSPMNAIEDNQWTREWEKLGKRYQPEGILMISAHWFTKGLFVQEEDNPRKIDDMYGFPSELYELKYPVKGSKRLSDKVFELLGNRVKINNTWGLDHGAWSVLVHMYPDASVPVVQVSVNALASSEEQYEIGRKLRTLREQGIMIMGSGNIVHNLGRVDWNRKNAFDWAIDFDDYIEKNVKSRNDIACIQYERAGTSARMAVPTTDHYYPFLTVLGAAEEDEIPKVFNKGYEVGSLSMTGYLFHG